MTNKILVFILILLVVPLAVYPFSLYSLTNNGVVADYEYYTEISNNGQHTNNQYYGTVVVFYPSGSGKNGPLCLDSAVGISVIKNDWPICSTNGELNGVNVVVRNSNGDGSSYMYDIAKNDEYNDHIVGIEGHTSTLSSSGEVRKQIINQIGAINKYGQIGYFTHLTNGTNGFAFRASGNFKYFLYFTNYKGEKIAFLDSNGNLYIKGNIYENYQD